MFRVSASSDGVTVCAAKEVKERAASLLCGCGNACAIIEPLKDTYLYYI